MLPLFSLVVDAWDPDMQGVSTDERIIKTRHPAPRAISLFIPMVINLQATLK